MAEVDLLIKLFETLKDALRDTNQLCQAMLNNQTSIANHMKTLPIEDLKQVLKDHSKESSDEIGTCTETVESKTDTILQKVNAMDNKLTKMILVVTVTFSLLTVAYFVGRYSMDNTEELKKWEEKIQKEQEADHKALRKELIEAIREEMRKRHP